MESVLGQRYLLKSNRSSRMKVKIFESTVLPVLTYRAQTWALTVKQLNKLQSTQNSMLRSILGVRMLDKVSLGEIYERTKARKVRVVAPDPLSSNTQVTLLGTVEINRTSF